MKGYIIYDEQSLKKNGFFADKLKKELSLLGAEAEIIVGQPNEKCDFAIMRVYNESINAYLDKNGIPTFNCSRTAAICNDKWKTYLLLSKSGITVAKTQRAEECDLPYPRVVKARHGHGGSEVFWANDEAEFVSALSKTDDTVIVQPPVGKRGRDLRVYVIGGEPIVAMLRKSDSDFRSNFSLGGTAERYYLSEAETKLVKKISSLVKLDFGGIDFLLTDGGLLCNEIEDVVGCRMIYTYTDIDIIKKYARHIVCSLFKRQNA